MPGHREQREADGGDQRADGERQARPRGRTRPPDQRESANMIAMNGRSAAPAAVVE